MIEGKLVKGFRDFLPADEQKRKNFMHKIVKVFESFNYNPIDTPVLEYAETLLNKSGGETEKQIFRFIDNGGRDVALRFDLTVPFARYLAMHKEEVGLPFRRYHMAKVWRGEKPQKGRYREFMQCDFDLVGSETLQADLDILLTAYAIFKELGLQVEIHYNDRQTLRSFFVEQGVAQHETAILQAVDKLAKIGRDEVLTLIKPLTEKAEAILAYFEGKPALSPYLLELTETLKALGLANSFVYNPTITRGLDYYTGLVFESFLTALPSIGSVCSGGRYDNLVALYSKEPMTGVGGSVGLDRLLAALDELGIHFAENNELKVLIFQSNQVARANTLAFQLREFGAVVEIYPNPKKIDAQLKYANRIGAGYCIALEEGETYSLRNMANRSQQHGLSFMQIVAFLKGVQ